jgi:glycosyltransferase involved in cell wall biosynthesis
LMTTSPAALRKSGLTTSAPRSSDNDRPKILVLLGAFWPGHEATGPNQSFVALSKALRKDFDFTIVARDRPFGARQAAAQSGAWIDLGYAKIRYCNVSRVTGALSFSKILRTAPHDLLMMNGFFDREFTIPALLLRRMGRIPRPPAILSTRGEFSNGALGLKAYRKHAYIEFARRFDLAGDVWLHTTGPQEAEDVGKGYPYSRGILITPNIHPLGTLPNLREAKERPCPLRLAFLGRIARVKNLDYALEVLSQVKSAVAFDIFGPIQQGDYWQECQHIIARLPPHVTVTYRGVIAHDIVPSTLATADLFFLPTRGENFGHAILDALGAGLPVVISDQTPFKDLERQDAGWSLPLDQPGRFAETIDTVAAMSLDKRLQLRAGARRLAEHFVDHSDAVASNRRMLASVIGGRSRSE